MPLLGGNDLEQVLNAKVGCDQMERHLREDVIMPLSGEILARKYCPRLQND